MRLIHVFSLLQNVRLIVEIKNHSYQSQQWTSDTIWSTSLICSNVLLISAGNFHSRNSLQRTGIFFLSRSILNFGITSVCSYIYVRFWFKDTLKTIIELWKDVKTTNLGKDHSNESSVAAYRLLRWILTRPFETTKGFLIQFLPPSEITIFINVFQDDGWEQFCTLPCDFYTSKGQSSPLYFLVFWICFWLQTIVISTKTCFLLCINSMECVYTSNHQRSEKSISWVLSKNYWHAKENSISSDTVPKIPLIVNIFPLYRFRMLNRIVTSVHPCQYVQAKSFIWRIYIHSSTNQYVQDVQCKMLMIVYIKQKSMFNKLVIITYLMKHL